MPILTASVTELSHHVLESVSRQILSRFLIRMGIDHIINDDVYIKTKYSSISDTSDGELNARLRKDRIVADVTMQVNPNSVKWSEVLTFSHSNSYGVGNNLHRNHPIFNDREFGIGLYELAAPCSILMSCSIHVQDRAIAYSLPLKFFNKFQDSSVMSLIDLMYEYKLPNEIAAVLGSIYNHKRFTTKFDSFYQYLQVWSDKVIGMTRSKVGHDREELIVNKHNIECLSIVEYSEEEPNTDTTESSTNMFVINFTMTTQFNMVNALALSYPILIENQLLPIEVIPLPRELRERYVDGTLMDQGIDQFHSACKWLHKEYVQVPFYDDWIMAPHCRLRDKSHTPYFIGLCTIDEGYPSTIVDLKCNLGDNYMLPAISKKLLTRQEEIYSGGSLQPDAILTVSVFYGDTLLDPSELFFTDELELEQCGRRINMPYRLVLTELTDLRYLHPRYYPLLLEFIQYFDYHVIAQIWWLCEHGDMNIELSFHDSEHNMWIERDIFTKRKRDIASINMLKLIDLFTGKEYTVTFDGSTGNGKLRFQDIYSLVMNKHGDRNGNRIVTRVITADIKPQRRIPVRYKVSS